MERFQVFVDPELEPIMGRYLEIRREELAEVLVAIHAEDAEMTRLLGHRLKGSGGSYGMDGLTVLGKNIEEAAKVDDFSTALVMAGLVREYLDSVEIIYREPDAT